MHHLTSVEFLAASGCLNGLATPLLSCVGVVWCVLVVGCCAVCGGGELYAVCGVVCGVAASCVVWCLVVAVCCVLCVVYVSHTVLTWRMCELV